jgi:hypothetical protein
VSSLRCLVAVAATLDQTGLVERLAAVQAPTLIADQLNDLLEAEDWLCCVVGVAAGVVIWSGSTASIASLQTTQVAERFMLHRLLA